MAEERHFIRAAEPLRIEQSPLSRVFVAWQQARDSMKATALLSTPVAHRAVRRHPACLPPCRGKAKADSAAPLSQRITALARRGFGPRR
ncbi:hypothetical protein [Pseudomonas sp. RIT-PI-AD]|uniref:hypothetical protein n=1 Tax=Pseudomonas sp. RIT-PI-AD TaxID=3035294 RepID=UPI0021D9F0FC|nr:hypothetical protein [Pseudomonas sp. RIT-PI-AD]